MSWAYLRRLKEEGLQVEWTSPFLNFYSQTSFLPPPLHPLEKSRLARGACRRLGLFKQEIPSSAGQFPEYAGYAAKGLILKKEMAGLKECGLVFINAENCIRPGTLRGRKILFMAYLAKQWGKRCVIVNHTLDLSDPALMEMARAVYPLLDEAQFRDEETVERYAKTLRPAGDWSFVPDFAYTYRPLEKESWLKAANRPGYHSVWPDSAESFDPSVPYVTVSASSILGMPGHEKTDKSPAFLELCKRLRKEFPQVVLTAPCVPDERTLRPVAASLGLPLIGLATPVQQAIDLMAHAQVHIGGRWHPAIFSALGGVPWVSLTSNNHKAKSLARQLGYQAPTFDLLQLERHVEEIAALAVSYAREGETLRARIRGRALELGRQAEEGPRFVRRFLKT